MIQPEFQKQIDEFLDYYRNVALMSPKSCMARKYNIKNFAKYTGCKNIQSLTNEDYNRWIKYKTSRNVNACSLNAYRQSLLCMIKYFRDIGVHTQFKVALAPIFKDDPKKMRVYYKREEVLKVAEQAPKEVQLMILIAFETGMRISELANLRISNFCRNRVNYVGKGKKSHFAFISEPTYKKLEKYILDFRITDYLWPNPADKRPENSSTVARMMKKEFEKLGFNDFHPHALRHSFATDLQRQGASVEEISHMIGHSSVTTTERYLHGFDERQMEKLFEKYHNYA